MADQAVEELGDAPGRTAARRRRRSAASVSARPCVICTFLPAQLRSSFMSWLPGTHRAEPPATMSAPAAACRGLRGRGPPGRRRTPPCALGVGVRLAVGVRRRVVARASSEQLVQLVAAAVDVADDVERAVFVAAGRSTAAPARPSPPRPPRALAARRRAGSPPLRARGATGAVATAACGRRAGRSPGRAGRGSALADRSGRFEHDGHRQAVVLAGQLDQRLAGLGLHVGGVDDRQPPQRQPLAGDEVQHLERVAS